MQTRLSFFLFFLLNLCIFTVAFLPFQKSHHVIIVPKQETKQRMSWEELYILQINVLCGNGLCF